MLATYQRKDASGGSDHDCWRRTLKQLDVFLDRLASVKHFDSDFFRPTAKVLDEAVVLFLDLVG